MPELPDLTVYARNLEPVIRAKHVDGAKILNSKRCNVDSETLNERLSGRQIVSCQRSGKEIYIDFDGAVLAIHLMLDGYLAIEPKTPAPKFARLQLSFRDSPTCLWVCDPRGLATFTLDPEESRIPDALSPDLTESYLKEQLQAFGTKPIKALLIDQSKIRGIGNAYADEILYSSGISPESKCIALPDHVASKLLRSIRECLLVAIQELDQRHPGMINGEYREFLSVHRKDLDTTLAGEAILKKQVAGKSTYFTDTQKLYD